MNEKQITIVDKEYSGADTVEQGHCTLRPYDCKHWRDNSMCAVPQANCRFKLETHGKQRKPTKKRKPKWDECVCLDCGNRWFASSTEHFNFTFCEACHSINIGGEYNKPPTQNT